MDWGRAYEPGGRTSPTDPQHLQAFLAAGYRTGMRKGEILHLTWNKVVLKNRLIRLEASATKEEAAKTIPIGEEFLKVLKRIPKGILQDHCWERIFSNIGSM